MQRHIDMKKKAHDLMSIACYVFLKRELVLFLSLISLFNVPVFSQPIQDIFLVQNQYKSFKNLYFTENANLINTVFQDKQGMIWAGTKHGLFCYDGYRSQGFFSELGSDANTIFSIVQVDSAHLCLGTDYGLLLFNLYTERFESSYHATEHLKAIRSLALFDHKLWIGSRDSGLFYYDFASSSLSAIPLNEGMDQSTVYSLEPALDKLFIGTYNGLSCYDPHKGIRRFIPLADEKEHLMVNSLLWDNNRSCLWIGTEGYLFQYFSKTEKLQRKEVLFKNSFKSLSLDRKGNVLIGTDDGLYIYEPFQGGTKHITHDSRNTHSLCNNIIWCIFRDRDNNVWLGTDRGLSLSSFNPAFKYVHISELMNSGDGNLFTVTFCDSKGNYWLGGVNGLILLERIGLNKDDYNVRWFRMGDINNPLSHNRIRCVYEDKDHFIWIATDGSVLRYDESTRQFVHYKIIDSSGERNANWAYDLYEDEEGRLWIATFMGGLFVVNKKNLIRHNSDLPYVAEYNFFEKRDKLDALSNIIYKILPDRDGYIWVSSQSGLARINSHSMAVRKKNIYLDNMVCDNNGYIWYSSLDKLNRLDTHTFGVKSIAIPQLKENQIHALVMEKDHLWLSSSEGVYTVDCNTFQIVNVSVPNNYYQTGFYDNEHNVIIWGGEDAITCVSPHVAYSLSKANPIVVTSVWMNNKRLTPGIDYKGGSIRFQNEIRLAFSGNNIMIELSEFTYSQESNERIFYRLYDSDDDWRKLEAGENRISFAHLSPGDYTLSIRNGQSDNRLLCPVTEFHFTILPPWYLSVYAYVLYGSLFLLVLFILLRQVQLRSKRRYEQMEKDKFLELSRLKTDFFVNMSHELKTPLSLIIAPLSRLIAETKNIDHKQKLEFIHQNSLRLNMLIHKILDFKQMEHESESVLIRSHVELCAFCRNVLDTFSSAFMEKEIHSHFSSNSAAIWMNVDALKMESVFVNIITNAIKYMGDTERWIEFSLLEDKDKGFVSITVADNGVGIEQNDLPYVFIRFFQSKHISKNTKGSGIGLYLVRKFIELHNGTVNIISSGEGKGATVTITLPLEGENLLPFLHEEVESEFKLTEQELRPILLIIDDNIEIVQFMVESFSANYKCLKATNGKEGFSIACEQKPDLIIVDQMMPEMDGLEFCRSLRRFQQTNSIPVIMLTAKDDTDTEMKSIKAGVDVFMAKPFDLNRLMLRMAQLLQARKSLEKSLRIETITRPTEILESESADEVLLEHITKTIEDRMEDTSFNVTMLSEISRIDAKQLYRKLKQLTGYTPVNYIRQIRMKKAAMLLSQNKFTISEVMYMVGYTNASYFSKCFVAEFGVTPSLFMLR